MGRETWTDVQVEGVQRVRVRVANDRRVTGLTIYDDDITSETFRALSLPVLIAKALRYEGDRETLGRPDGTAEFYKHVAAAYRSASTESGHPAVALAHENAVPVETVRRWVKEARRRGYLTAGRKGRAI